MPAPPPDADEDAAPAMGAPEAATARTAPGAVSAGGAPDADAPAGQPGSDTALAGPPAEAAGFAAQRGSGATVPADATPHDAAATRQPETDLPPADHAPEAEAPAEEPEPAPPIPGEALRVAEALLFASDRPITPARLQTALPRECDARAVLAALAATRAEAPVRLVEVAGGFAFRTAPELAPSITRVVEAPRRLPRAAMETLAIVAYHQPVTRAEIEEMRGASLSQSTLESLLDAALIAPRGHKEVPGRPSLWGTTPRFLEQFGLKALADLPRREELVNEPTLPLSAPREAQANGAAPARTPAEPQPAEA